MGGQHRADRDPLLLAAGQLGERPVPQVGEPEQVEGLLDALAHHGGCQPQRLHAVGELVLDVVGDEAGQRVLADEADHVGEVARPVGGGVPAVDDDPAGQGAAGEVRHQAVDGAQQRRLAGAGAAHRPAQLALGDGQVDAGEHRRRRRRRTSRSRGRARSSRPPPSEAGPVGSGVDAAAAARAPRAAAPTRMPRQASGGTGGICVRRGQDHQRRVDPDLPERQHRGRRTARRPPATRAAPTGRAGSGSGRCAARRRTIAGDRQARRPTSSAGSPSQLSAVPAEQPVEPEADPEHARRRPGVEVSRRARGSATVVRP